MNFVSILILRIKSEQPEFYKKLQKFAMVAIIITGIVYGVLWLNIIPIPQPLHDKLNTACYAIGTFLGGIFFTSSTGTKDPSLVSNDTKKAIIDSSSETNP